MNGKLDVGRVFERIFQIYRDQFALLIGGALALFVPVALINGLLYEAGGFVLSLVANAIALVASYLYQGMVVEAGPRHPRRQARPDDRRSVLRGRPSRRRRCSWRASWPASQSRLASCC